MEGKIGMTKMKKAVVLLVLVIFLFSITGCSNDSENEIIGEVSIAEVDENGDIMIPKEEITDEVRYYSYIFEDVTIGLLAVRDSGGNVRIVINTCQSCGGSPMAYFIQVGDKIQCQNCRSLFDIDSLGELEDGGCNPIGIENMTDDGEMIKISHTELEQYKEKFENWQGPTV